VRGGSVEVTPPSRTTTPEQAAALTHAISADRLNTYLRLTDRDVERATALYIWNRDLSLAILADIAIVEVALRNALHMQLSATWGERWYADPSLRPPEVVVRMACDQGFFFALDYRKDVEIW